MEIPDSQFAIELPADAQAYDDVTGQGLLPAGTPLTAWDDPPPPARPWPWLWIGGWALLALLTLCVALLGYGRWRAKKRAGSVSDG